MHREKSIEQWRCSWILLMEMQNKGLFSSQTVANGVAQLAKLLGPVCCLQLLACLGGNRFWCQEAGLQQGDGLPINVATSKHGPVVGRVNRRTFWTKSFYLFKKKKKARCSQSAVLNSFKMPCGIDT